MIKKISTALLLVLGLSGCMNAAGYQKLSMSAAIEKMEKENDYVILDVRTKNEYDQGHIPNALLIPNESIDNSIIEKLPSKKQTIYVYCRSGNRSKQAANKLLKLGYTDVIDIGGINDWPYELAYDK